MRVEAESLFRTKPISEIRNVEASTNKQIQDKQAELRQLVGTRYRDLIDSADSIVQMKSACEAIASSISSIHLHIRSLSAQTPKHHAPNANRQRIYGIACRVKYLVDTPENIWGCLDESLFLEAAARYVRAKHVHSNLISDPNHSNSIFSNFPLLQHQWQIVESFKPQISQRSRDRLLDSGLPVGAYADALATVAVADELEPPQVLCLFLDSRKTWVSQRLSAPSSSLSSNVVSVFCDVLSVIQISVGQVGELFLRALNDMPLFYKVILNSPPASQLFGGIPNPDQEVMMWKSFRDSLESSMVMLDKSYIAKTCLSWLRDCGQQIVDKVKGKYLIDAIASGQELGAAEKLIRDTMNSKEVLEGSLDWLRSVFGSEIELPWSRIQELVLGDDSDLWNEIFEDAFVRRMKLIIDSRFTDLMAEINVSNLIHAVGVAAGEATDFQAYLSRPSTGGGVWFIEAKTAKKSAQLPGQKVLPEEIDLQSCLNAYFGAEVSRIRDAVDSRCQSVLEDLLGFLESPKASLRLKDLAPYLQSKCYESISTMLSEIDSELGALYASLEGRNKDSDPLPAPTVVERALFIGRLLFALQNHSRHIPVLLGSPRFWAKDTLAAVFDKLPSLLRQSSTDLSLSDSLGRQVFTSPRRQTSAATAALLGANETANPKLDELSRTMRDLNIRAHTLWISWLSTELSNILSWDLEKDDVLSATTSSKGWEELVVKQDQADDESSEMKISLPSMPSPYVISFLFRACEEIHRVGGHVLDKSVVQKFASSLLEKVTGIYENFLSVRDVNGSQVSEKGVLQILLDIRFVADVLCGGDSSISELPRLQTPKTRSTFRMKRGQLQSKSLIQERIHALVTSLSQKLDPIDWLTYEPYLWENEKQSYLKHAVLFGFFVQLCRLYTDAAQKLPSNAESNVMRCSTVPRFKYLPISAPALASKGKSRTSVPAALDDIMSKETWKAYANGELSQNMDLSNNLSFGVAAPLLKSFMQVGSKFGESTLKLGSILTDGQVGIFKDRSTTSMSTFGDMLPLQAAGLLSSFTTTRSDS